MFLLKLFTLPTKRYPTNIYIHKVWVKYCDGASFAGDAPDLPDSQAGPASSTPLHFRGRRILEASVRALTTAFGLGAGSASTSVLLAGCSAGGLAALLAADAVPRWLPPSVDKYKVLVGSGFFMDVQTVHSFTHVYASQMRAMFKLQNLAATLAPACLANQRLNRLKQQQQRERLSGGLVEGLMRLAPNASSTSSSSDDFLDSGWRCALAEYAAPHVKAPLFFLESAADAWQLGCVLTPLALDSAAEVAYTDGCYSGNGKAFANAVGSASVVRTPGDSDGWGACVQSYGSSLSEVHCSAQELGAVQRFGHAVVGAAAGESPAARRHGSGAFVTSCVALPNIAACTPPPQHCFATFTGISQVLVPLRLYPSGLGLGCSISSANARPGQQRQQRERRRRGGQPKASTSSHPRLQRQQRGRRCPRGYRTQAGRGGGAVRGGGAGDAQRRRASGDAGCGRPVVARQCDQPTRFVPPLRAAHHAALSVQPHVPGLQRPSATGSQQRLRPAALSGRSLSGRTVPLLRGGRQSGGGEGRVAHCERRRRVRCRASGVFFGAPRLPRPPPRPPPPPRRSSRW